MFSFHHFDRWRHRLWSTFPLLSAFTPGGCVLCCIYRGQRSGWGRELQEKSEVQCLRLAHCLHIHTLNFRQERNFPVTDSDFSLGVFTFGICPISVGLCSEIPSKTKLQREILSSLFFTWVFNSSFYSIYNIKCCLTLCIQYLLFVVLLLKWVAPFGINKSSECEITVFKDTQC